MKNNISVSIDDGHPLDLKAAEILDKKRIKTTFYIPIKNSTGRPTLNRKQIKWLTQNPLFTVGGHSYNHVDLTRMTLDKAREEIRTGKNELEEIISKKINTFAWPFGKYNKNLINITKNLGFLDCRSAAIFNVNEKSKNNLLWHPNLQLYPYSLHQDIKNSFKRIDIRSFLIRIRFFNKKHLDFIGILKTINIPIHFWFHSWELDRMRMWSLLESI